jgi:Family of unknown function (DUF5681)
VPNNGVGYGRPPVHTFRKGQSGNRSGKQRLTEAERAKKLICQEAYRLLTMREGDKVTRIPALWYLRHLKRSLTTRDGRGCRLLSRVPIRSVFAIQHRCKFTWHTLAIAHVCAKGSLLRG